MVGPGRSHPRWGVLLFVLLISLAALSTSVYSSVPLSISTYPCVSHNSDAEVSILGYKSLSLGDGKPYPPRNLVVVPGPNYVDISWDPPSYTAQITSYYIYRNNFSNDEAQPDIVVSGDTYNYRDYDVIVGTKYWYSLRSVDINGPGYWGDTEWAAPGKTVPSEPASIGAEAMENASFIWWEWSYDEGGTELISYRVYRGTSSDNLSFIAAVGAGGVTATHVDTGLVNGVVYYYRVSAYNSMGEGPPSDTTRVKPNWAARNVTVSPTSVDHCGPVTITLTWQHPIGNYSEIIRYEIRGPVDPTEVDRENTSFATTVSGGWGYSFQVVAVYDDGNRVYSSGVGVGAPMCEGVSCSICPFLSILLVVTVGLSVVAVILVLKRRKRMRD